MNSRVALLSAGLAAVLALSACTIGKPKAEKEPEDPLQAVINEAYEIRAELFDTQSRLLRDCMAEQGFDVYGPSLETTHSEWFGGQPDQLPMEPPDIDNIPTVAEAKKQGFGVWEWEALSGRVAVREEESEFFTLGEEYQDRYYRALYGDDLVDNFSEDYAFWGGSSPGEMELDLDGSYQSMASDTLYSETEWASGGCWTEVTEVIFVPSGDVDEVDFARGLVSIGQQPDTYSGGRSVEDYETEVQDVRDEWSACTADRGHDYVELTLYGQEVRFYVQLFYASRSKMEKLYDHEYDYPEVDAPKGAPLAYQDAYDLEFAYALDAAECAVEVDLRATLQDEWDRAFEDVAVEFEAQIFAWRDALQEALERANALLNE